MNNAHRVQQTLDWLWENGIRHICICPGGRNAPFVMALDGAKDVHVHSGFDERATAFFALGLIQKYQQPTAMIVTSGTAVAEVLPAVIEAYYTQLPLVVISADRPRRLRFTGAPQTIQQVNIFGSYVEKCVDIEDEWSPVDWTKKLPLHLNLCFDEPLVTGVQTWRPSSQPTRVVKNNHLQRWQNTQMIATTAQELKDQWQAFHRQSHSPLLIISTLRGEDQKAVNQWLSLWPGFIYAEGTSGLREIQHPGVLRSGDRYLQQLVQQKKVDGVVRLGGIPTARVWRNLETENLPVFSLSHLPFPGLSKGETFCGDVPYLLSHVGELPERPLSTAWVEKDQNLTAERDQLFAVYPLSEPALMRQLSVQIKSADTVYVGNSLPIREWDLCAQRDTAVTVHANRGANGIDGQLATALGLSDPHKDLWVILGDLTALYDANALWFWQKMSARLKLVVINNQGGKIFERLFANRLFYNEHNLSFAGWAEQWGLPYVRCETGITSPTSESFLMEVIPDEKQTQLFWRDYDQLWKS